VLAGLESALGRLRELEREQQQLEARVNLLQEENLELSTEVRRGAGVRATPQRVCFAWAQGSCCCTCWYQHTQCAMKGGQSH
jgi:hypothetical protein